MTKKRRVGIFFGIDNVAIAEVENRKVINYYSSPYGASLEEGVLNFDDIDKTKLAQILPKLLADKNIDTRDVVVSLPTRNIILRSFFMPVMSRFELDSSAAEFEARKYIPFKPRELTYDYQAFAAKEGGVRKLRILFVAVKNESLEKYRFAIVQAGLNIKYIEPSAISLLRALTLRKNILANKTQVLVEVSKGGGNIIVSDKGVPTFINDFKLPTDLNNDSSADDIFTTTLANDIRLSLDYYRRNIPEAQINSVVLCSQDISGQIIENLKKEIDVLITPVQTKDVLGDQYLDDLSLLSAYGAGLRGSVASRLTIDLNKVAAPTEVEEAKAGLTPKQIKKTIQTAIVAVTIVLVIYFFNFPKIAALEEEFKRIKIQRSQYSEFSNLSRPELESVLSDLNKKSKAFASLKKQKTLSPLLDALPRLMPQGVWLRSLSFNAGQARQQRSLNISGSCFLADTSKQIDSISEFISNIKKEPAYNKEFKDISASSMRQRNVDNWTVTDFDISCR